MVITHLRFANYWDGFPHKIFFFKVQLNRAKHSHTTAIIYTSVITLTSTIK